MPIESLDILMALKAIALSPSLKNSDRPIASALLDHYNRKTGQCDPSIERLARLVGVSTRTVMRSLARIEIAGLFRRVRHGGHLNRNFYESNWTKLAAIAGEWQDRMMQSSRARARTNTSPSTRQPCHLSDDSPVTQTCRNNLSKETSRGLAKKHVGRLTASAIDNAIGKGSVAAGRDQAERRWIEELNARFSSLPITYAEIIEAITEQIRDAATDAELQRCGAGISYLTKQLKLG